MKLKTITMGCLGLLSLTISDAAPNTIILDETGVANLRLQTVEIDEQTFETTVFSIGRIEEIPSKHSVLSSRVAGRVMELKAFEGDYVQSGDIIATVETRQLGDPPPTIQLKAPQSGIVITSHVRLGQPVQPDVELMDISDRSQMWAVAKIPEKEASKVHVGSLARIQVPALGDVVFEAKLVRFGVNADRSAGAVEGVFLVDNAEGRLLPGMRAEFAVILDQRDDVLAVPREAIQGDPANRIVFVKDFDLPNAFLRVPVVTGERNDRYVEVLSGLFPSDEVVTQGSYSLGFVGSGAGISLKEALDAAHGHEHNEDGSEMTDEQRRAASKPDDAHVHEHTDETHGRWLMIYAIVMTFFSIIVLQRLMNRNSVNELERT